MLRKNSIIKFVFLAIIAILGILLCVCPFAVPYSTSNYNGFVGAMNKGVELNGGVSAIYECALPNGSEKELSKAIDDSVSKIKTMFENEGYQELVVSRQGEDKISVLVSGGKETDYSFDYIEDRKELSFTLSEYSDSLTNPEVYVKSNAISKVRPTYDHESQSYGVIINFTEEGKKDIEKLKEKAKSAGNDSVYIYWGEINTDNLLTDVVIDDLTGDSLLLKSSEITDAYTATEAAYSIASGSLDVELSLKETAAVSAVFGKNTLLYVGICLLVVILGTMLFMWLRYGHLGLLANLSFAFYLVIYTMLMVAIPFVVLNLAAVIGSLFAFAMVVLAHVYIFEKIRQEYAIGKKIHLSCKAGFKKSLWPIIDSHVLIVLACIFIWIFAPAAIKVFAITILTGAIISVFSSLALSRYFVKIYLPINSTKPKKLHLYRDKNVKEVKDEEVEIIPEENVSTETIGGDNE